MNRNIINAPDLHRAVDHAMVSLPGSLGAYRSDIRAYLLRASQFNETVKKARRRKNDPDWAQRAFSQGHTLYRFHDDIPEHLSWEIEGLLEDLEATAKLLSNGSSPIKPEVRAFLKSLPHKTVEMSDLQKEASGLRHRAQMLELKERRHENLRPASRIERGKTTAHRCASLDEVIKLGRNAKNCLKDDEDHWKRFVRGRSDYWVLRDSRRIMAVLEVDRGCGRIREALGHDNIKIPLHDARKVVALCKEAGIRIDDPSLGLLPEFDETPLIEALPIIIGNRLATYTEWDAAVRIDITDDDQNELLMELGAETTLTLSFDEATSCAQAAFEGRDPRQAVMIFGKKTLRKIMKKVALYQARPTLVQHRLLALSA